MDGTHRPDSAHSTSRAGCVRVRRSRTKRQGRFQGSETRLVRQCKRRSPLPAALEDSAHLLAARPAEAMAVSRMRRRASARTQRLACRLPFSLRGGLSPPCRAPLTRNRSAATPHDSPADAHPDHARPSAAVRDAAIGAVLPINRHDSEYCEERDQFLERYYRLVTQFELMGGSFDRARAGITDAIGYSRSAREERTA